MHSVILEAPEGVLVRLGQDEKVSLHDRRRILARELVAQRLRIDPDDIRIERDAPSIFGYHTRLFAFHDRSAERLPISITTASDRDATVVAVYEAPLAVGLDIRSARADDATSAEILRHFPMWSTSTPIEQLTHWSAVHAVLDADARGTRVHPEHVRLAIGAKRGWVPDRPVRYDLADLSQSGFLITLAYGIDPD